MRMPHHNFLFRTSLWMAILLFLPLINFSQISTIDSLQQELNKAKEDSTRILLMNEMALNLQKNNQDSALFLSDSGLSLAKKINFKSGVYELLLTKGIIYFDHYREDSALIVLEFAREIASEMGDKKRQAKVLSIIGNTYNNLNKKRLAVNYLNESLELSTAIEDKNKQFDVLNSLGKVYSYLTVYDTSELYYKRALELQKELGNKKYQAGILMNLGNNAARGKDLKKALYYYEQGLVLLREMEDKKGEAPLYNMMGYSCLVLGNLPLSLKYYQTALGIQEAEGNKEGVAQTCSALSDVYVFMEDYPKALFFIEKAMKLWEEQEGETHKNNLLFQKGKVFKLKGDYESAIQYFNRILHRDRKNKITRISSGLLYEIGYCYEKLNQLDSAFAHLQIALEQSTEANDFFLKSQSLKSIGSIHFKQGKTNQAIGELKEAIEAASFSGNKDDEMEAAAVLYRIYKSQNSQGQALYYHERYRSLQDSLFNEKNVKQITRLEANYEFEKEKQELDFQRAQEIKQQESFQRLTLIALGIAILFILTIFWYYRSKQKANAELQRLNDQILQQNKQLEEINKIKSRFFTNISHEFRTPLTVIKGMINQIQEEPKIWLEKGSNLIRRNTENLLNLVNQILDLRKLESGALEAKFSRGDIIQYLRYITESFHSFAQAKNIQLHFLSTVAEIQMDFDSEKLLRIISNLLSNAVKFTPEGGNVYMQASLQSENDISQLHIRVQDTGVGISKDQLPHIFDRFYQVDDSTTRKGEGTGIGLALIKELVKLLKGEIEVNSIVGKGTTFLLKLPISLNVEEILPRQSPNSLEELAKLSEVNEAQILEAPSQVSRIFPVNSNKEQELLGESNTAYPKLLVVEDNADVVEYLIACLQNDYQLEIAVNGQEGIDKAIELVPDLIVSDVMMPEKDGYELCDYLKQDERTSHIPIILLTAKADLDSKLQGLEYGADAYLTKPFEQKELMVRLKKLMELRRKLQRHYSHASLESLKALPTPSPQGVFLQKVYQLIETNLSNLDYDMLRLSRDLGMSRSQIFRKIKALTGKAPSLFIRSYRLRKGKELLFSTDLTVSEIAYDVGFSNVKYFSDAFLEEFGERPSATRK